MEENVENYADVNKKDYFDFSYYIEEASNPEMDKVFLNLNVAPMSVTFVRGDGQMFRRDQKNKQKEIQENHLKIKQNVEKAFQQTEGRIHLLSKKGLNKANKNVIETHLISLKKKLLTPDQNMIILEETLKSELNQLNEFIDKSM